MRYRALIIVMLCAVMLAACASKPTDPKSRFLRGDPCKPPCIEGIEPGITTLAEAEQKLVNSHHIGADQATIQTYGTSPVLEWSYGESEWAGRANSGSDGDGSAAVAGISVAMPDMCLTEIID